MTNLSGSFKDDLLRGIEFVWGHGIISGVTQGLFPVQMLREEQQCQRSNWGQQFVREKNYPLCYLSGVKDTTIVDVKILTDIASNTGK